MSSVATIVQNPSTGTFPTTPFSHTCHKCGAALSHSFPAVADDAQRRISELESQVRILTGKATAAGTTECVVVTPSMAMDATTTIVHDTDEVLTGLLVDKLADYEDELRQLRSSNQHSEQKLAIPPQSPSRPSTAPASRPHLPSRLSNLLPSTRRTTSQPPGLPDPSGTPGHPPSDSADLLSLLTREQTLRQAAENRVSQTNEEIEELSTQLFTEANEMVAAERKARARLEERVAILEGRDKEKRSRLELLENRLERIERVRGLLSQEQRS